MSWERRSWEFWRHRASALALLASLQGGGGPAQLAAVRPMETSGFPAAASWGQGLRVEGQPGEAAFPGFWEVLPCTALGSRDGAGTQGPWLGDGDPRQKKWVEAGEPCLGSRPCSVPQSPGRPCHWEAGQTGLVTKALWSRTPGFEHRWLQEGPDPSLHRQEPRPEGTMFAEQPQPRCRVR